MKDITKLTLDELLSSEDEAIQRHGIAIYKRLRNPKGIPCCWCKTRKAFQKTWREIDGTTTSTLECEKCIDLKTSYLLEKYQF